MHARTTIAMGAILRIVRIVKTLAPMGATLRIVRIVKNSSPNNVRNAKGGTVSSTIFPIIGSDPFSPKVWGES